jgi:hypothetical protein
MLYKKNVVLIFMSFFFIFSATNAVSDDVFGTAWEQIVPGNDQIFDRDIEPACSGLPGTDPTFSFFVKRTNSRFTAIWFDGGGIGYNPVNVLYNRTFQPEVDEYIDEDGNIVAGDLQGAEYVSGGILNTDNPDNPFYGWNIIYVPYCSGDLHWGSRDVYYPDVMDLYLVDEILVKHHGADNMFSVLKWMGENIKDPVRLFVSGSSAGSYGILAAFPYLEKMYPKAKMTVLSDAGIGGLDYESGFLQIAMPTWGVDPDLLDFIPELGSPFYLTTIVDMMSTFTGVYPNIKFGQYTTAWDATQVMFYNMSKYPMDYTMWENWPMQFCAWNAMMSDVTTQLSDKPNFRYYIGPGTDHMVLQFDKMYTETAAGIDFVDWLREMVWRPHKLISYDGYMWQNVECEDCQQPVPPCQ